MFELEFMRNAFMACTIVGIVAGAVGYFLVLRGETFAGHALSHVGFPGATGAALIGLDPLLGMTVFTIVAGVGVGLLGERAHRDIAIGIVLTQALGLGLLFLHFYTTSAGMVTGLLFGSNVFGINLSRVYVLAALGLASLVALAAIGRPLLFASLQPELAEAKGIRLDFVSVLFMVIVAVTTTEAMQIVGVLLVFALLVAPAATAMRLTTGVRHGLAISIGLSVAITWISLTLSFYTDWPASFCIATLGTLAYIASFLVKRTR
jgi:zinc/manganese transport system permease protein